ncbi:MULTISPECIES: hypothetical protein [Cryobacterium]|uniref:hypothetical protein n=1 Tax=Cryobacterium TaxID=69578 RepID=UPI0010570F63|nr:MULTISPECIES: hypothetical protein [Cryobacterium]TFC44732.1 hypothetical protein E3O57_10295 [Cryobacterium sp. TMN-39-2]
MGANDGKSSGAGYEDPLRGLSEQDLILGKRAVKFKTILCVVTFVVSAGIAVFVFVNVPWDTRMPYDGKYNRSGNGIPMQIALLPVLILLFRLWRTGKKPDAHHMGKGSRVGYYILAPAMILACGVAQWVMGQTILTNGGYFAG